MEVLDRDQLLKRCRLLRDEGRLLVFTNGCFDILHRGHVDYLAAARSLGDILIVGVNSDRSVRHLKGPSRPLVSQEDRARVVASLRAVDMVTIFDEETPVALIRAILPDILVKGGDYDPNAEEGEGYIVGSREVRAAGGRVAVIPLTSGRSTTDIVRRMSHPRDAEGEPPPPACD